MIHHLSLCAVSLGINQTLWSLWKDGDHRVQAEPRVRKSCCEGSVQRASRGWQWPPHLGPSRKQVLEVVPSFSRPPQVTWHADIVLARGKTRAGLCLSLFLHHSLTNVGGRSPLPCHSFLPQAPLSSSGAQGPPTPTVLKPARWKRSQTHSHEGARTDNSLDGFFH